MKKDDLAISMRHALADALRTRELARMTRLLGRGLTPEEALDLSRGLQQALFEHFEGDRLYVPRETTDRKAKRLGAALQAGVPLLEAFATLGIPERTGYRLLRRRQRCR